MRTETTRQAVLAAWKTGWLGAAAVPVQLPNQKFKQPATGPWGRLAINYGSSQSQAVGGTLKRQTCTLELQLFSPEQTGTKSQTMAADLFGEIFDNLQLTPEAGLLIEFEDAGTFPAGTVDGYDQIVVSISFRVDKSH